MLDVPLLVQRTDRPAFDHASFDRLNPVTGQIASRAAVATLADASASSAARALPAALCHVNSATVHDEAQMPFGGLKSSGCGRPGGVAAIHEFTELRWITVSSRSGLYPI